MPQGWVSFKGLFCQTLRRDAFVVCVQCTAGAPCCTMRAPPMCGSVLLPAPPSSGRLLGCRTARRRLLLRQAQRSLHAFQQQQGQHGVGPRAQHVRRGSLVQCERALGGYRLGGAVQGAAVQSAYAVDDCSRKKGERRRKGGRQGGKGTLARPLHSRGHRARPPSLSSPHPAGSTGACRLRRRAAPPPSPPAPPPWLPAAAWRPGGRPARLTAAGPAGGAAGGP